jgi:hypothetical protein
MCYLELPRVPVNNISINKTLQSLRNTCTRQITIYSKRKVTKLWEHFLRFSNSKRALCNRKVFFRLRLPIDAKKENVCNGLAWMLSLFPQTSVESWSKTFSPMKIMNQSPHHHYWVEGEKGPKKGVLFYHATCTMASLGIHPSFVEVLNQFLSVCLSTN